MNRAFYLLPFVSLVALTAACGGDDDADNSSSSSSSGSPSSSGSTSSSSGSTSSSSSSGGSSSSSSSSGSVDPVPCVDTAFAFPADDSAVIPAATYADAFTLSSEFPFDVVGFYTSPVEISQGSGAWGEHGGIYTTEPSEAGDVIIHRLTAPVAANGTLTDDTITIAKPADLFSPASANYPPISSLPNNEYLLSYTTDPVDGTYPALAYLYSGTTQEQRAWSSNFFGAIGVTKGSSTRIVYHAYAPLTADQAPSSAGALYVTDSHDGKIADASVTSFPLMPTGTESSGPVVKDANGNVLVVTQGATVNLRALSRCGVADATASKDVAPFHTVTAVGTATLAMIPATATLPGYVVQISYGFSDVVPTVTTTPFTRSGDVFTAGTDLDLAIDADDLSNLSVYGDDKGYLWISNGSQVAKLRRRAN